MIMVTEANIDKNWQEYKELLLSTKYPGMEDLVQWLENETDFKEAPASSRYHNSFIGGLVNHSLNVYKIAKEVFGDLGNAFAITHESLIVTTLLHDLCKANFYTVSERNVKENGVWKKVPYFAVDERFPVGHGEKSVILAQRFIQLNDVEIAMIRNHMGFSRDETNQVSNLFSKYPESLILHMADLLATYTIESEDILDFQHEEIVKLLSL